MSRQEKPVDRSARLLDLIPFISTHQGIHVDDLAAEFGVTPSEMMKDLDLIFMCGLPSYTPLELIDLSYEGGHVTIRDPQNLTHPRKLSSHEGATLLMGLAALKAGDISQERASKIESLERKIKIALKIDAEQFVSLNDQNLEVRTSISSAIFAKKSLAIRYVNPTKDETTQRTISPQELFYRSGREHVLAYCHLVESQRVFDLSNITEVTSSNVEYRTAQRMTTLLDDIDGSVSITYNGSGVNFIERNPDLVVAHDPITRTAVVKYWSSEWLIRSILSYGGTVTLIEPKLLANEIAARVRSTWDLYQR